MSNTHPPTLQAQGKLVGLGGSLREASRSAAALRAGMAMAAELGLACETLDVRELQLPMYRPDWALADYPAEHQATLQRLVGAFRSADAMLWTCPAYHGAMSGVFKNALDFMQLLARDPRPYLQGCAVGLVSLSDRSPLGGMANCVQELRAWLAPTRVTLDDGDFDASLALKEEASLRRLRRLVGELAGFVASQPRAR